MTYMTWGTTVKPHTSTYIIRPVKYVFMIMCFIMCSFVIPPLLDLWPQETTEGWQGGLNSCGKGWEGLVMVQIKTCSRCSHGASCGVFLFIVMPPVEELCLVLRTDAVAIAGQSWKRRQRNSFGNPQWPFEGQRRWGAEVQVW